MYLFGINGLKFISNRKKTLSPQRTVWNPFPNPPNPIPNPPNPFPNPPNLSQTRRTLSQTRRTLSQTRGPTHRGTGCRQAAPRRWMPGSSRPGSRGWRPATGAWRTRQRGSGKTWPIPASSGAASACWGRPGPGWPWPGPRWGRSGGWCPAAGTAPRCWSESGHFFSVVSSFIVLSFFYRSLSKAGENVLKRKNCARIIAYTIHLIWNARNDTFIN